MNAAAFPIIAANENGTVVAKNGAAYAYLPKIRIKSSLSPKASFLKNDIILKDAGAPFRYALCVPVKTERSATNIYMFLPSIQSEKSFSAAAMADRERIFEIVGSSGVGAEPRRAYSEIAAAFTALERQNTGDGLPADVPETAKLLGRRLSSGLRSLGFRATVTCTDDVTSERYFKLNFHAFVYSVLTAAYVAMRISSSGTAEVTIGFDERIDTVFVSSRSATDASMPRGAKCAEDAIASLVPECAIEMMIDKSLSHAMAKMCTIKGGIFEFCIPLAAETRSAVVRSSSPIVSLGKVASAIVAGFAKNARQIAKRRK